MRAPHEIWLLKLVPAGRHGRLVSGVTLLIALLAAYAASGMFSGTSAYALPEVAVFFSVVVAYIVPVYHYITHLTANAVRDLAPWLPKSADADALIESVGSQRISRQCIATGTGLVAGIVHHIVLAGTLDGAVENVTRDGPSIAIALGTLSAWAFLTTAIFGLVRNAMLFAALGRTVRIDLLAPRAYTPFARVAVSSTLALIGAQAAFPIMWIDPNASALATIPGLMATAVAMLFLFALPLMSINRAIATAKRAELDRLDLIIGQAAADLPRQHDELRLLRLNPLLAYRREIDAVREWPFDTSVAGRLGLYLVIPPLTWIGAALIEMLIDDLV